MRATIAVASITAACLVDTACGQVACVDRPAGPTVAAETVQVELVPGVILDSEREALYVMSPGDAVECVDLRTGSLRWTSVGAARPLALAEGLLLAQAETSGTPGVLALVGLAAADGAVVGRVDLPLPVGVDASVDERLEASFGVEARPVAQGFLVSWRVTRQAVTGAEQRAAGFEQLQGSARIDPRSWRAEAVTASDLPPAQRSLPAPVQNLVAAGRLTGPIWTVDGVVATVTRAPDAAGDEVLLQRWRADDGRALPDVRLGEGFVVQFASADGRHLLASRPDEAGAAPDREAYTWALFSLETGERKADIRRPTLSEPFVLAGDLLVEVSGTAESRRIMAVDVGSGVERWHRPLRDTSYRGPVPDASRADR